MVSLGKVDETTKLNVSLLPTSPLPPTPVTRWPEAPDWDHRVPNVSMRFVSYLITRNKSLWENPSCRMNLVIFNSRGEPEELWGPRSTSGTELLLNSPLAEMLSVPPSSSQEQQLYDISRTKQVSRLYFILCPPPSDSVEAEATTIDHQLSEVMEERRLIARKFVQWIQKSMQE